MAVLGALAVALLLLPGAGWAHMGPSLPMLYPEGVEGELLARLAAEYLGEQAGRDVRLLPLPDAAAVLAGVRDRRAPLALVREERLPPLPEGVAWVGPPLPGPGGGWRVVAGEEALASLSFSLLPRWVAHLAQGLARVDWPAALRRVARGDGARRVALDLLRENDLP